MFQGHTSCRLIRSGVPARIAMTLVILMKTAAIVLLIVISSSAVLYCITAKARIVTVTSVSLAASPDIVPEVVDDMGVTWFIVSGQFHFIDDRRAWGC